MEMTSQKNNNSSSEDDSDDDANVPPRQPTTKAKAKPTPTSDDSDSDNEANSKNKKNNNDQDSDSTDTDSEDSDDEDNGAAAARKKQRKRKKERLEQNKGRRQRTNSGAGPFSPDAEFRSFKVFSLASAVFIFITSVIAFQWNCLYAHMCFVTEDPAVPQPQSDYIVPVIAVSLLLGLLSHLLIMSESPNSLLGFGVITLVWSICKYTPLVRHCVDSNSPRTCCVLLFVVYVPPPSSTVVMVLGSICFGNADPTVSLALSNDAWDASPFSNEVISKYYTDVAALQTKMQFNLNSLGGCAIALSILQIFHSLCCLLFSATLLRS